MVASFTSCSTAKVSMTISLGLIVVPVKSLNMDFTSVILLFTFAVIVVRVIVMVCADAI